MTESARRIVAEAEVILGAPTTLSLLDGIDGRKGSLEPDMPAAAPPTVKLLVTQRRAGEWWRPVLYGVARYLCAIAWARAIRN